LGQLRKACNALVAAGCSVNKTCGLHVHVGARDLSASEILTVIRRYGYNESKIDAIIPKSRRANNNYFCKSMSSYYMGRFDVIDPGTMNALCNSTFRDRYLKVNPQAYLRHGTVEFRHHSGSVNASKICNWATFCVNFVNQTVAAQRQAVAATNSVVEAPPARRRGRPPRATVGTAPGSNPYRNGSKKAKLWNLLLTGSRCMDTLAYQLNTSEASVAAMLSQFRQAHPNLIRRTGTRGNYSYRISQVGAVEQAATPAADRPSVVVTNAYVLRNTIQLEPFFGLSNEIRSYYVERAMEFAD